MYRVLLALVVLVAPATARSWKVSYFFDDARQTLHFTDIAVPSATRGIAVGTIVDEVGEHLPKHVAVLTIDGGDTWTQVKLSDAPRSLFFLNDSIGWMVTDRGISKTDESGRTWRRIYKNSNLLTVWFLDENHGFAAGVEKTFIETHDGGVTWKPVLVAKNGPGAKTVTAFTQIAFADEKIGLAIGTVFGQFRDTTIELETRDAGATWQTTSASLVGRIADLKLKDWTGFALFEFPRTAEFPSEVFHLELQNGKSNSIFRRKDRRVFSMVSFKERLFLATLEKPARESPRVRLPARLHILESTDLKTWSESPVDYRARATSLISAGFDPAHMLVATDAGMILRLQ